jgi:CHASE1-domain containing sensor protein
MQEQKYEELENRASLSQEAEKKLEARSRIHREIELMKEEGKAFVLTTEEEDMLRSFRRFKFRMRKDGEVFAWQTRKPEGVQIAEETAEIIHPSEHVR